MGHLSYRPALGLAINAPLDGFRVFFSGKVNQCSILRDQTTGDLFFLIFFLKNPTIYKPGSQLYLCPPPLPPPFLPAVHEKKFFFCRFKGTFGLFWGGGGTCPSGPLWSGTAQHSSRCALNGFTNLPRSRPLVRYCHFGVAPVNYSDSDFDG